MKREVFWSPPIFISIAHLFLLLLNRLTLCPGAHISRNSWTSTVSTDFLIWAHSLKLQNWYNAGAKQPELLLCPSLLDGQINSCRWLIPLLVWHSQDASSKTCWWAAASLKPSQPFRHRHHKTLISPHLGSVSLAINLHFHFQSAGLPSPPLLPWYCVSLLCFCFRLFLSFKVDYLIFVHSQRQPSPWIKSFMMKNEKTLLFGLSQWVVF